MSRFGYTSLGFGSGASAAAGFSNVYSMDFLGEDEIVNIGDLPDMDGIPALTISLWVYMDEDGNVAFMGNNDAADGIFFQSFGGALYFGVGHATATTGYVICAGATPSLSAWHHICCVYDASASSPRGFVYVDGSAVSITSKTLPVTSNNADAADGFLMGKYIPGGYYWDGKIDELAMWTSALTAGNAATLANAAASSGSKAIDLDAQSFAKPAHWWRMGDGATWNGSVWTIPDGGTPAAPATTVDGTSANMLYAARVGDVP